jgi:hypothetical protein
MNNTLHLHFSYNSKKKEYIFVFYNKNRVELNFYIKKRVSLKFNFFYGIYKNITFKGRKFEIL